MSAISYFLSIFLIPLFLCYFSFSRTFIFRFVLWFMACDSWRPLVICLLHVVPVIASWLCVCFVVDISIVIYDALMIL